MAFSISEDHVLSVPTNNGYVTVSVHFTCGSVSRALAEVDNLHVSADVARDVVADLVATLNARVNALAKP